MITKPTSVEALKDIFLEMLLATTDDVTKIAPASVLNGIGFGVGKLSQKILKDVGVIESNIFPETAFDIQLDDIAERNGYSPRFGVSKSSTFLRLVGDSGTFYEKAVHTFTGKQGVVFELEADVTLGATGFTYTKVSSTSSSASANVEPLTITQVLPASPIGHKFVINEYKADGGRDIESDTLFRQRTVEGVNILATGTLAKYEHAFQKINSNVLRIYKGGITNDGKLRIIVSTVTGADLTGSEITTLKQKTEEFLSFTDQRSGVEIENITYTPIDISTRVDLDPTADADQVRVDMQARIQKLIDWRFWEFGDIVEFEKMLLAVASTPSVNRVLEGFFFPNQDIIPANNTLPRIRGFLLLDLDGNIISDAGGALQTVFYPSPADFSFQSTVLASI